MNCVKKKTNINYVYAKIVFDSVQNMKQIRK